MRSPSGEGAEVRYRVDPSAEGGVDVGAWRPPAVLLESGVAAILRRKDNQRVDILRRKDRDYLSITLTVFSSGLY